MTNTAPFTNWDGNMFDLGPLYPMVGTEVALVVILLICWIGWHILQMRQENQEYDDEAKRLREGGNLQRALQDEHTPERM